MIHIITDSTFGITKEYADKNDIKIVNLKSILDGQISDEGYEESWPEFYLRFRNSKGFPTTSQPNAEEFKKKIDEILEKDKNAEIIILTISSSLSGTINSAILATNDYKNQKIMAVDSEQASVCGRMMIEEIVNLIGLGTTFEELINKVIPVLKEKLKIQFVPDNMTALKRGGRIGGLAATLATILKIKPIFVFHKSLIKIAKKTLGLARAIQEMIIALPQKIKKLYICYIDDATHLETIKLKLTSKNIKWDGIVPIGPVFGSHVGIGSIGLASLEEYKL